MTAHHTIAVEAGTPPPDVTIDAPPEPVPDALTETAAGRVRADRVDLSQGAIGRVIAHEVHAEQAALGVVRARSAVIAEGATGAIAATHVENRGGFAVLMLARQVSGDVTVLLDWRAVIAAVGALLVLGRLLRGRR
jgi:hypothetical protein